MQSPTFRLKRKRIDRSTAVYGQGQAGFKRKLLRPGYIPSKMVKRFVINVVTAGKPRGYRLNSAIFRGYFNGLDHGILDHRFEVEVDPSLRVWRNSAKDFFEGTVLAGLLKDVEVAE